jgi:uncharacterized protein YuzE
MKLSRTAPRNHTVILSRADGEGSQAAYFEILRCAQDDGVSVGLIRAFCLAARPEERKAAMAESQRHVKIWYDPEGDYLEVIFDQKAGYFRETENDQVMEKVDDDGNVLGFSVLRVSAMKEKPLDVAL